MTWARIARSFNRLFLSTELVCCALINFHKSFASLTPFVLTLRTSGQGTQVRIEGHAGPFMVPSIPQGGRSRKLTTNGVKL